MIQVWCQRSETFCGKTINDVFDVIIKTPPLLNDNNTGAAATGDVASTRATVALEFDHLTHQ